MLLTASGTHQEQQGLAGFSLVFKTNRRNGLAFTSSHLREAFMALSDLY